MRERHVLRIPITSIKMAMTFNSMFNAIFDQISKRVVEKFQPKRADGKDATINDIRVVCDRVMAESFIQISFGENETKVLHKPEEYKSCCYVLTRGDRSGDECGKKSKSGCNYCSTHSTVIERAKVKKPTCEHIFTKGKIPGSVCTATVSDGGKYCSKHKKKSTTASSESEGDEVVVAVKTKKQEKKVPTAKAAPKVVVKAKSTKKVEEEKEDISDDEDEKLSDCSESDVEFHEEIVDNEDTNDEDDNADDDE